MTSLKPFRYILRYLIDPYFHSEARIEELAAFCMASKIEEVMLFIAAEELSTGHPTAAELDAYIGLGCRLKERLAGEGIALSLNPWSTTYHNCRGRTLREGQAFRLMVGDNGVTSSVTACPLCENWRAYLAQSFSQLVAAIRPVALWIEDDWRLKNHGAFLGWGGCFCAEHLRCFSSRVGEAVTRERLIETIVAPGPPHPWRGLWLDLSRETLLEPLAEVATAIRRASPGTRVALMSSNPDAHAAEGRDWWAFQGAVGREPAFLTRPNMGPYTQYHALQSPPVTTRLTLANLRGPLEVYPELENSPRCGAYSKSRAFSVWQMFHAALLGAAGITINHYDMLGNGISLDSDFGSGLAEAKPVLDALRALEIDDRQAEGAGILFSPEISRAIHTGQAGRKGMSALSQNTTLWSATCFALGICHRFSSEPGAGSGPMFVNEQTLRAFDDEAIAALLARGVIADALSVEVLLERGFGPRVGIRNARRRNLSETGYAYEQIEAGGYGAPGLEYPRMTAQRCSRWLLEMEISPRAQTPSTIRSADHQTLWPGSVYHEDALGGRSLCLTYPLNGEAQFFMAFFNVYRKEFLQRLLLRHFPSPRLACVGNPALHPYRIPVAGGGTLLAVLNPTDDRVNAVEWSVTPGSLNGGRWLCLHEDGEWRPITPSRRNGEVGERLLFPWRVPALKGGFFLHRE